MTGRTILLARTGPVPPIRDPSNVCAKANRSAAGAGKPSYSRPRSMPAPSSPYRGWPAPGPPARLLPPALSAKPGSTTRPSSSTVLLTETVLRSKITSPQVMFAQLEHIATVSRLRNVRLGIVPFAASYRRCRPTPSSCSTNGSPSSRASVARWTCGTPRDVELHAADLDAFAAVTLADDAAHYSKRSDVLDDLIRHARRQGQQVLRLTPSSRLA